VIAMLGRWPASFTVLLLLLTLLVLIAVGVV
jgi:hypothetical protein